MHTTDTKEKFVHLRASGFSLAKISEELGVAKQTLINWNSEFRIKISNLEALRLEALQEQYALTVEARVTLFGSTLNQLIEELSLRDLSDIPTDKLLMLIAKYSDLLGKEGVKPSFVDDDAARQQTELCDLLSGLAYG